MGHPQGAHATQQLAEFLAAMSGFTDERPAAQAAVERAAEALDCEVGVVIYDESMLSIGFPAGRIPVDVIRAAAGRRPASLDVVGVGPCHLMVTDLSGRGTGHLLLARSWEPFSVEELARSGPWPGCCP
jgi:ATP:corrinoid adenosyltransferase